jgi:hypothetical protein
MLEREISWRITFGLLFLAVVAAVCLTGRSLPSIWDTLLIVTLVAPALVPQRYLWVGIAVSGVLMTFLAIYTLLTPWKVMHAGLIAAALIYDAAAIIGFRQSQRKIAAE